MAIDEIFARAEMLEQSLGVLFGPALAKDAHLVGVAAERGLAGQCLSAIDWPLHCGDLAQSLATVCIVQE